MNKLNLISAMQSVDSNSRTVPIITTSSEEAHSMLDHLSSEYLVKFSAMEVLVGDSYFRFYPLHSYDLEDFKNRFAGFQVPGFIVDSVVLASHPRVVAYLLPHLQCRIRTVLPEQPFNFIFV